MASRLIGAIITALLLLIPASAQNILGGVIFGDVKAKASYVGPGDIVSGAYGWYSCSRAYSSADTSNACNVCLPADTVCADLTISNGFAVVPAALSTCNITTVICTIKIAYDKTGSGHNVSNATIANRPTFRPAMASNGCPTTALPCMRFVAANSQTLSMAGTFGQAQPATLSIVYIESGSNGEPVNHFNFAFITSGGSGGLIGLYAGTGGFNSTAVNGSWHAVQGVINSTSSVTYVDGSSSTGNAGTGGAFQGITLGSATVVGDFDGSLAEAGLWPLGFSPTQAANVNSNQHNATSGYNF